MNAINKKLKPSDQIEKEYGREGKLVLWSLYRSERKANCTFESLCKTILECK